jgi:hypothetical protein
LEGNLTGSSGDGKSLRNAIQPINKDNDIRGLRRRACTTRAHGDPDIGGCQCWRIINAVSNHRC